LADEKSLENAADTILRDHSDFGVLVNCAAIVGREEINQITYPVFEKAWKINAIAPLYLTSRLLDAIIKNEADIISVGTTHDSKAGTPDQLAYVSTKWGLRGGSGNISAYLSKTKSRLLHIHLGGMNTKLHEKDYRAKIDDPAAWMSPKDIADIFMYLLSLPKQIEISEITINRKGRRFV
jgi:NAD(P)-dependent dehydrogenase (short-subunit alcohol dehydrogenase family)